MPKKLLLFSTIPPSVYIKKYKTLILLVMIFFLALLLRLYGIDWDQGQHLHPDERFLTMVGSDISLPGSVGDYFSTGTSPLNPYNYPNYQFFVYGTFPLFLTKTLSSLFNQDNYQYFHLYGRFLSALFDSANIILLFYITKKLLRKHSPFALIPSLIYSLIILPVQLSHFFTVDTFLTFFILLTFTLLIYHKTPLAGFAFGIGLACKISALYFSPVILLLFIYDVKNSTLLKTLIKYLLFTILAFISFRFFKPYSFTGLITLNPKFIANIQSLQAMSSAESNFPPSVQWLSKTPLIFSLQNLIVFGFGPILLIIPALIKRLYKRTKATFYITVSLFWIIFLYFYQGSQFVHTMRYFLPIYPFLSLVLGLILIYSSVRLRVAIITIQIALALCFVSIYSRPHPRVQASLWIYENIPPFSTLSTEVWDDTLPLNLPNYSSDIYRHQQLALYDPDTTEKWYQLDSQLNQIDYLVMSSNRLWGSIPKVVKKYPKTSAFYTSLFDGLTPFAKVREFSSYPGVILPFLNKCIYFGPTDYPTRASSNRWFETDPNCSYPGIYLRDNIAEEAFTVYDHPQVLIFKHRY